jgi:hypothetical protein
MRPMDNNFQASGDMADWPANVPGKPTQAAVFGCVDKDNRKRCQILWTGQFPDLEKALYWAAKHEVAAVRKDKWIMASRVCWQHELTPEQAVEHCYRVMEPQLDRAMGHIKRTDSLEGIDIGDGPMKPVDVTKAKEVYVEVVSQDDPAGDPLASFMAPGSVLGGGFGRNRGMTDENGCCN